MTTNSAEILSQFTSQEILFSSRVSRLSLTELELKSSIRNEYIINVWRNHGFEPLIPLIKPYSAYGGWTADFRVSAYDDSLMFADHKVADVEICWLDSTRFLARTSWSEWLVWLAGRMRALRSTTTAPIILATWGQDSEGTEALQTLTDSLPGTYFADMNAACAEADATLLDRRSSTLAGTPLSSAAQVALAQKLACHWLPAALLPPIKAVAVDLDNTLHVGVLGEDGIQGVKLTSGHAGLQNYIKSLRQRGIFIALISRNERQDVEALFAHRQDYPLRWEDFSVIEVSWGDKGAALERIANALRIAPDAVLFVDDNAGELASVSMQLPLVHTVFAHTDASLTRRVIHHYPGLWRWKVESDDAKRIEDLMASTEREALAKNIANPMEYFRSLGVNLTFHNNPHNQLTRLADLCSKTNQFNLALRRYNQAEVAEYLSRDDACVTSVQLSDRLSDSGVIAVIIAERHGVELVVNELCVSCRALGRQLEDTIVMLSLRNMPIFAGCQVVTFNVLHGPRNKPALDWLASILGQGSPEPGQHTLSAQQLINFHAPEGVAVIKE